jgi:hypothetical protein
VKKDCLFGKKWLAEQAQTIITKRKKKKPEKKKKESDAKQTLTNKPRVLA